MNMLQAALISAFRKLVRTVVAVLIIALPAVIEAFKQGAPTDDLIAKGVFGLLVSGLVAVLAFLERINATPPPPPVPPPSVAKP